MRPVERVREQARALWRFARPLQELSEQLPLPPSIPAGRTVNVPERGEMFVREAGTAGRGPATVLLHGWALTADLSWFSSVYEVASRAGRMVAPDLRGHGRGLRSQESFTMEAAADDVAALIDHLDLAPAVLVGYSMGGSVALQVCHRHPEAVAGLVLLSTAVQYRCDIWERLQWLGLAGVEYVLRFGAPQGIVDRYLRRAAERSPGLERYTGWIKGELRRGDASDIAAAGRSTSAFDARDFAGDIRVPTAVVISGRDQMVKPARQRELADAIPRAHVVDLDAAHNAWMVQPAEVGAAIEKGLWFVQAALSAEPTPEEPARPREPAVQFGITHL